MILLSVLLEGAWAREAAAQNELMRVLSAVFGQTGH
jgi:hypothetical protein